MAKMNFVQTCVLVLCLCYGAASDCVMRGQCHQVNGFPRNCAYDGHAIPILVENQGNQENLEDAVRILLHRCPQFILNENGEQMPDINVVTCCDVGQLRGMAESILIAEGVLGRCPACLRNFVRQICEMNCSPDQSHFVAIDTLPLDEERNFVEAVHYSVHKDFLDGAFDSCSGVIVPQTGLPAVNMMCGNAPICNSTTWFGFTGDIANNPLAPVQVNFLRMNTTENSMHVRPLPCSETADGDLPCSCIDCESTCPTGYEPTPPDICTVFSIHCAGFAAGLVYLVITIMILVCLGVRDFKRNKLPKRSVKTKKRKLNKTTKSIQWIFSKIGAFSANNPVLIIMLTTWVVFAMFFGFLRLQLTTNPIELWSSPDSRSRQNLDYFNTRFGPFYRAAQVYLQMKGLSPFTVDGVTYGPAFHVEAVKELLRLEQTVIDIGRDDGGITLEEVCYAPLRQRGAEPDVDQCVSMSVTTYISSIDNVNNETYAYLTDIQNCLNSFLSLSCMATWGGGAEPEIVFGGFEGDNILSADTLLINFPLANFLLEDDLKPVMEWEQKFIDLLHAYVDSPEKPDFVDVSFGAERSIEDEIQRVSQAEAIPIAISYVIMFIYVTISLGNVKYCRTWFIESKIMVAIGSIIVVVAAIFCGIGVLGYAQITLTLLAINVIPFFVLSVGIDNVFLMVNTLHDLQYRLKEYDDYNENFSFNKKREFLFSKMMMKVGPSMFVSSVTQITCFGIGSLTNFPAVVTFSIFCSISLGFLFVFQITTVIAILSLDYKRASQNRFDVLFCVQKKILNDSDPLNSETPYKSIFARLMSPYSKFIQRWYMKIIIGVVFAAMICASAMMIPQIEIGLDQEMALPRDSYVYKYLQAVSGLLRLGPPVYFVLKGGLNFTDPYHQNVVCGGQVCNEDSLTTQIFLASRFSNITYISRSSNSWIDDFFDWTSLFGACCKYNTTDGSFCQSTDNSPECAFCSIDRADWNNGLRPSKEAFERYVPFFLRDTPTEICNRGGLASYYSAVNYVLDSEGNAEVHDSNFMAYHTALSTSKDFITAVKYAYEISDNITNAIHNHTGLDVEVFPYGIFHVFFEQYLTMWSDTFASIGYCLIGAFVFNLIASGFNILTTFAVILTSIMVVVNMMGVMFIWNIPLNAVSCVNLIVSIGMAVEFCSHITYAFATSQCPPEERVTDALKQVGSTIITGITFTNIPVIVLAFSYTEIIEVFFFRMFFSLVILGFLHGMIFLPVLLSYLNSFKKNKKNEDNSS